MQLSLDDAVRFARQRHAAGQDYEAWKVYKQVLAVDPAHKQALSGLQALDVRFDTTTGASVLAHKTYTAPGPNFEEIDLEIGRGKTPKAKLLAYYLPQFHETDINNRSWGNGFTEWTNVMRGMSRFQGQVQPRVPRDLGFYDVTKEGVLHRQAELAKAMGIHGFCFYHYFFDGKRLLDKPVRMLLKDKSIDMPFCIMWANENWTRAWDGGTKEVLVPQGYSPEFDTDFVDDLAMHFVDERYIRIGDRPLMFIYAIADLPEAKKRIATWRELLFKRHKLEPLIYMVDRGETVPSDYDLDGSIEFPPHKLWPRFKNVSTNQVWIDPTAETKVGEYIEAAKIMVGYGMPDHPHIKCVMPSWDNDARRPGRGWSFKGSTPKIFAKWLHRAIELAQTKPIGGETFVAINAWNEWAEGCVLEPDVYFGGAYLNEVARTVFKP